MTIIKLPPHTTELLQPLDVAVFKSLKDTWGAFLFKRLKQARSRLTKSEFSTLLSSPEVWKEAFGEEKIKNGFRKCGIYPFSRDQYPKHRFHPKILAKYEEWVQAGKPAYSAEEFAEMFRENHERNALEVTEDVDEVNISASTDVTKTVDETIFFEGRHGKVVRYFIPDDDPEARILMPSLPAKPTVLTPQATQRICSTPQQDDQPSSSKTSANTSFQELVLGKMEQPKGNNKSQQGKRRKVNPFGTIVTSEAEFTKAMEEQTKKQKKKKKPQDEDPQENEDINSDDEDFPENDTDRNPDLPNFPPENERQAYLYLRDIWENISPPTKEDLVGKYFAAIYVHNNKPRLYLGKVIRRFLEDPDSLASGLELDCLKPPTGNDGILEELPSHLARDIDIFPLYNIIAGPLEATLMKGNKWLFKSYQDVKATFAMVKKIEREKDFGNL